MKTILIIILTLTLTALSLSAQVTINARAITVSVDGINAFNAFNQTQIAGTTGLSVAVDDKQTALRVDSGADIRIGDLLKIDSEVVLVTAKTGRDLTITRAQLGTVAAAHAATAAVQGLKYRSLKEFAEQAIIDTFGRLVDLYPPADIKSDQDKAAASLATRKAVAAQ